MKMLTRFAAVFAMLAVVLPGAAWAGSADDADTVTVSVPASIGISDEAGNFTLTFANGSSTNSISSNKTVGYIVNSNTMPNAALAGALSAKISSAITGVTLQANMASDSYTNVGTASNAILTPVNTATPVAVGTSLTALANKEESSGAAGQILNGTFFVSWNAKATADLSPGDGGSTTLTVTIKDA